ncbi:hypothetical protein [Kistimonas scapharcae]
MTDAEVTQIIQEVAVSTDQNLISRLGSEYNSKHRKLFCDYMITKLNDSLPDDLPRYRLMKDDSHIQGQRSEDVTYITLDMNDSSYNNTAKKKLQSNYSNLCELLSSRRDICRGLLMACYSNGFMTAAHKEEIEAEPSNYKKAISLINAIMGRPEEESGPVIAWLVDNKHIAP